MRIPRLTGLLGTFGIFFYEAGFIGSLLHIPVFTAIGGILIAPVWFIWIAIAFTKMK